jgi:hypothetical protein
VRSSPFIDANPSGAVSSNFDTSCEVCYSLLWVLVVEEQRKEVLPASHRVRKSLHIRSLPLITNSIALTKKGRKRMAPAASTDAAASPWIPVVWMPHTSLSQTSSVRLTVKVAWWTPPSLASVSLAATTRPAEEWRIRATVHGMAGTPLGLPTETRGSPLRLATSSADPRTAVVDGCSHTCVWEETIRLPVRWRDLPRDAYLLLQVLSPTDEQVRLSSVACVGRLPLPRFARACLLLRSPCFLVCHHW